MSFLEWGERIGEKVEFEILGEHHGENEILMEWVQAMKIKNVPWLLPVPMRVHMYLTKKGSDGKQKIHRYEEEWWFNQQLNQRTTLPPLGWLHENLRRYTGMLLEGALRNGLL